MKFFLISLNQQDMEEFKKIPTDISAIGVRYLSAYLKKAGHEVNILFLCKPYGKKENEAEIVQIIELIEKKQPDLIGVGLMSNHFFRAVAITQAIKKRGGLAPIIWGGIHPTIRPEESLNFADLICVGEGEIAMEKLMNNLNNFKDLKIEGIWHKDVDKIIEGGHGPLVIDIDSLPYPDYDLNNQYILHQEKIPPLSVEILKQYSPMSHGYHRLLSTRGCPHACAYCCSSVFRNFYGACYLRRRSVDNFIEEMVEVKNKFPFIKFFKIMDDSFTFNNIEWLKEFNEKYKQKINLPFSCMVSPLTINEEKLMLLIDAGLRNVQIGLQSGSDRVNSQIYLRYIKTDDFLKAMELFEKYQGRFNFVVDVIVDNPYEQEDDLLKTINTLNQIKKPFALSMFSLAIYPGTILYQRATNDKLLTDENEYLSKQYQILKHNVFNKIIYLTSRLTKSKIDWLTKNRHNFSVQLGINLLYFIYTKKNKLPPSVLKLIFKIRRLILVTS